jgi:signal transduction histidine kinase
MKRGSHRKQILLFLIAVMLPSLVLIILTLRMISQEKELSQKRMADERQRMAREIGQHLFVRLENIKMQETSVAANQKYMSAKIEYVNPEVVLIGFVEGRQLILPWEQNQEIDDTRRLLESSELTQKIRLAEREEFAQKNLNQAARLYRQAMNTAKHPVQKGYARLHLARSLSKSAQNAEALTHYRGILELPYSMSDEYGIPLSLYAAGRLLEIGENYQDILRSIQKGMEEKHWLSPAASYLLSDVIDLLLNKLADGLLREAAKSCKQLLQEHIHKLEQALALQMDYLSLGLSANQGTQNEKNRPLWTSYGENPWLVSLASSLSGRPPLLIVVDGPKVLASLKMDTGFAEAFPVKFLFVPEGDPDGLSVGANFQNLEIKFSENEKEMLSSLWSARPAFYLVALLLILGITLFGAYLLWRDVRREVQMAEMRSQFVSSVSHELKTPLTAIRMFAETLRLGRSKDLEAQREYLDTIVNESERLTRLLNNVLDFSKIEQGKKIYRPETASLSEIIQRAARAMEYPLSQQGFKLHVQADEGLPEVRVDRDAIEQAILNLLHNAMKYSGESREIELRLQRKDGHALIQVVDRGVGIDPREKERIFEKFYRIPSEENKRLPGTGLGLTLVSHIVKSHGGHIEVESAPGKGSTFSIYLPLEKEL